MTMLPARRSRRNLTIVSPSREFEDIYDRMGQLMNLAFGSLMPDTMTADLPWIPSADVSETDGAYVVHVELPGMSKDQINVELQDRELVVSGEIPQPEDDEGQQRRSSRRTGRFEYRAYLPGDVNPDGVRAELSDGVLTVTVPKSEQARPRRIEITG